MPTLGNTLNELLEAVLAGFLIIAVLRFLMQLCAVDTRNPITSLIARLTYPPIRVLRLFLPQGRRIDYASVLLMLGVASAKIMLRHGAPPEQLMAWGGVAVVAIAEVLHAVIGLLTMTLIISVVLSWFAPQTSHPAAHMVRELCAPVLRPFQRIIPAWQGLDFSPILAFLTLNFVNKLLLSIDHYGLRLMLN